MGIPEITILLMGVLAGALVTEIWIRIRKEAVWRKWEMRDPQVQVLRETIKRIEHSRTNR